MCRKVASENKEHNQPREVNINNIQNLKKEDNTNKKLKEQKISQHYNTIGKLISKKLIKNKSVPKFRKYTIQNSLENQNLSFYFVKKNLLKQSSNKALLLMNEKLKSKNKDKLNSSPNSYSPLNSSKLIKKFTDKEI